MGSNRSMADFLSGIFTHEKILNYLKNGNHVSVVEIDNLLYAVVVKDGKNIDKIKINDINVFSDYTEHIHSNFRKSKLQNSIEIHDGVNLDADQINLLYCTTNLSTEASEMNQLVLRKVFFGKDIDDIKAISEMGDILWYVAMTLKIIGFGVSDVLKANIIKLKIRYSNKSIKLSRKDEVKENQEIKNYLIRKNGEN